MTEWLCPIWIDAICINQSNNEEKSQQVAMMGEIYSGAAEVLVWLGEDAFDDAATATEFLLEFVAWYSAYEADYGPILGWRSTVSAAVDEAVKQFFLPRHDRLKCLVSLLWDSPYFERVWGLQEVFRARHATCFRGKAVFEWDHVGRLGGLAPRITWLSDTINLIAASSKTRCDGTVMTNIGITKLWCKLGAPDFTRLLWLSRRSFKATDPRDKVYGMLGLMKDRSIQVTPDYDLSVREVYIHASVAAMKEAGVSLLVEAQSGSRLTRYKSGTEEIVDAEGCPSWVPRYDLPWTRSEGAPASLTAGAASAEMHPAFDVDVQTGILRIKGCVFGSVDYTCTALRVTPVDDLDIFVQGTEDFEKSISTLLHRHVAWLIEVLTLVAATSNGWTTQDLEKVAHGLILGQYLDMRSGERAVSDFCKLVLELKNRDVDTSSLPADDILNLYGAQADTLGTVEGAMYYLRSVFWNSSNRVPFVTETGHFGMAPMFAKRGDVVCLLYGCPNPLIMRRQDQYWHLMGDAYVHDIMDVSCSWHAEEEGVADRGHRASISSSSVRMHCWNPRLNGSKSIDWWYRSVVVSQDVCYPVHRRGGSAMIGQ